MRGLAGRWLYTEQQARTCTKGKPRLGCGPPPRKREGHSRSATMAGLFLPDLPEDSRGSAHPRLKNLIIESLRAWLAAGDTGREGPSAISTGSFGARAKLSNVAVPKANRRPGSIHASIPFRNCHGRLAAAKSSTCLRARTFLLGHDQFRECRAPIGSAGPCSPRRCRG